MMVFSDPGRPTGETTYPAQRDPEEFEGWPRGDTVSGESPARPVYPERPDRDAKDNLAGLMPGQGPWKGEPRSLYPVAPSGAGIG